MSGMVRNGIRSKSSPSEKIAQTEHQTSTENPDPSCVQPIGEPDPAQFPAATITNPGAIKTFHEQGIPEWGRPEEHSGDEK
jgi:hypothetical protein